MAWSNSIIKEKRVQYTEVASCWQLNGYVYSIYEENQRSGNWKYDLSCLRFIDDTKKMFCNKNHARSILLLALLCEYVIPSLLIRFDVNG